MPIREQDQRCIAVAGTTSTSSDVNLAKKYRGVIGYQFATRKNCDSIGEVVAR